MWQTERHQNPTAEREYVMFDSHSPKKWYTVAGLKVNDQLVAYATRFLAVRLKNYVWSHHRALKAKV